MEGGKEGDRWERREEKRKKETKEVMKRKGKYERSKELR